MMMNCCCLYLRKAVLPIWSFDCWHFVWRVYILLLYTEWNQWCNMGWFWWLGIFCIWFLYMGIWSLKLAYVAWSLSHQKRNICWNSWAKMFSECIYILYMKIACQVVAGDRDVEFPLDRYSIIRDQLVRLYSFDF